MPRPAWLLSSVAFVLTFAGGLALHAPSSIAQETKPPSQRATAICPEVAKLAEAIALARDIGQEAQQTVDIINSTIELKPQEVVLIQQLVGFTYEHPELTPYEHSKKSESSCFDFFVTYESQESQ